MNTNSVVSYLAAQALWQSPRLLAYVIGMVVCGVRARRAPLAATLAIVGLGLMLIASVAVMIVQGIAVQGGASVAASSRQSLMIVGLVGTLARTVGVVLMIVAMFAGRSREGGEGFEVPMGAGR